MVREIANYPIWRSDPDLYPIWRSDPDFADWEGPLREEYPDRTDEELCRLMREINDGYLDDEKENLGRIVCPDGIFAVGSIGSWHGTFTGVLNCSYTRLTDCFRHYVRGDSEIQIYVDRYGELRIDEQHHDGCNSYLFRAYRPGVSEYRKNSLMDLCFAGKRDYRKRMYSITYRLGDLIGDVYGWTFPNRPSIR